MPNYGLTTSNGTGKAALTTLTRWNDRVPRHTLFTACGTQADGWGIFNDPVDTAKRTQRLNMANAVLTAGGLPTITELPADGVFMPNPPGASFDAVVGRLVNPALFNWVPISYPASFPGKNSSLDNAWQPNNISFLDSVTLGTNQMISLIKNTPGTFALSGMSQGAMVISNVLKAMQTGGVLADRMKDCIGAVSFGNPMRKLGASFPGGTPAPGAGMFSLTSATGKANLNGLAGTPVPAWWWEMCTPGDFFGTPPMSSVSGTVGTALNQVACTFATFKGISTDPMEMAANLATAILGAADTVIRTLLSKQGSSTMNAIGLWIRDQGFLAGVQSNKVFSPVIKALLGTQNLTGLYGAANPHVLYGVAKPPTRPSGTIPAYGSNPAWTISLPGVNSNSTYVDVALAYLNARGALIAPR